MIKLKIKNKIIMTKIKQNYMKTLITMRLFIKNLYKLSKLFKIIK